jgi:hypothetical protein
MQVGTSYVSTLEKCVQSLVESRSPSDIFKTLLRGSQCAAPRGAIFLVRQNTVKGWGSIGYDEPVAKAQRAFRTGAEHGWLGELIGDPVGEIRVRRAGGDPDFGQAAPSDSAAIAVRVKGRTIAVLMTERSADESPWLPDTLSLLVAVAQLRLELDLALRKLKTATAGPQPVVPSMEPLPAPPAVSQAISAGSVGPVLIDTPPRPQEGTAEIEALSEVAEENAEIIAARRFAKLVATDIRLYNEEAVMLGRREHDLADRLGDQLGRGRETFLKRHGGMGSAALEILHDAFVEVLAGGDSELLPVSVLDEP